MSEIRRLIPRLDHVGTASLALGMAACGNGGGANPPTTHATAREVADALCNYYASCHPDRPAWLRRASR